MSFERRSKPKSEKPHYCRKPWFNPFWIRWRDGARWRCGNPQARQYAGMATIYINGCGQLWERKTVCGYECVTIWERIDG